jgi:ATP-dependent Lon protease
MTDRQAQTILMPVVDWRHLSDLLYELWSKINIDYYKDSAAGVFKALAE